jgi:hypothetical protein
MKPGRQRWLNSLMRERLPTGVELPGETTTTAPGLSTDAKPPGGRESRREDLLGPRTPRGTTALPGSRLTVTAAGSKAEEGRRSRSSTVGHTTGMLDGGGWCWLSPGWDLAPPQVAPFPLCRSTPHPDKRVIVQRVLKALLAHHAPPADDLGGRGRFTLGGEEPDLGVLTTEAVLCPLERRQPVRQLATRSALRLPHDQTGLFGPLPEHRLDVLLGQDRHEVSDSGIGIPTDGVIHLGLDLVGRNGGIRAVEPPDQLVGH